MATQLNARLVHPQLRGQIRFNNAARLRYGSREAGVAGLYGAVSPASVVSVSDHADFSDSLGATVLFGAGSYGLQIGLPGNPGRRFRFMPAVEFGSGSVARIRTSRTVAAANNKISGAVVLGSRTAGSGVLQFTDRRSINIVGSATAANRPDKSDFFEFLDVGDFWMLHGVCHAAVAGAVQGV